MLKPHENELWSLLLAEDPNYAMAKQIIITYPQENLVKSIHERGRSILMAALDTEIKDRNFIEFIVTHPNFDISFEAPSLNRSNLKSLIAAGIPYLVEQFKNHPIMFDTNKKLGYELAKQSLKTAECMYETYKEEDPDSDETKQAASEVNNAKSILAIIRDATIRHAIAIDSGVIYERLAAAGAKPQGRLLDGNLSGMFVKPSTHPNILKWVRGELQNSSFSAATNSQAFYRLEDAHRQINALEHAMNKDLAAVHRDGLEELTELANSLVATTK